MPSILFIDDDANFLEAISEYFEDLSEKVTKGDKPQVFSAQGPRRAVPILKAQKIDVVVTEIKLNEMDGIQFLGVLQKHFPQMTKIVLTTMSADDHRDACMTAGAMVYLEKPKTREEVQDRYQSIKAILDSSITDYRQARSNGELRGMIFKYLTKGNKNLLFIKANGLTGRIYVFDGQITHVMFGKLMGVNALREIMGLARAELKHDEYEQPKATTVGVGLWESFFKDLLNPGATLPEGDASQFTGKFLVPKSSGDTGVRPAIGAPRPVARPASPGDSGVRPPVGSARPAGSPPVPSIGLTNVGAKPAGTPTNVPSKEPLGGGIKEGAKEGAKESPLMNLNTSPLMDASAIGPVKPPLRAAGGTPIPPKLPGSTGAFSPPKSPGSGSSMFAVSSPSPSPNRSSAFTAPPRQTGPGTPASSTGATIPGIRPEAPLPRPVQPASAAPANPPSAPASAVSAGHGSRGPIPVPAGHGSRGPMPVVPVVGASAPTASGARSPVVVSPTGPTLSNPSIRPGTSVPGRPGQPVPFVTSGPAPSPQAPVPNPPPALVPVAPVDDALLDEFVVCTDRLRLLKTKNSADPEHLLDLIQFVSITMDLLKRELRFDNLRDVEVEGDGFNAVVCFRGDVRGFAKSTSNEISPEALVQALGPVLDASRHRPPGSAVRG